MLNNSPKAANYLPGDGATELLTTADVTPSRSERLPQCLEGFASFAEALDYAARGETGMNFFSSRGELSAVLTYADLRAHALDLAGRLASTGLNRGDRMAVVADTSPEFAITFAACQYAGIIPVPLPLSINFGGREAYAERLRGMLTAASARAVVAPADLIDTMWDAARPTAVRFVGTIADLRALPVSGRRYKALGNNEPCYIQYSSGSTSFPRGVLVTQKALVANTTAMAQHGLGIVPGDRCASWLPLYHDMGLVGCFLTPLMTQCSVDYLATSSFARRPLVWLQLISRTRATIAYSPTFGYELCARRASNQSDLDLDLSCWRLAGIGGEMIRPTALNDFAQRFAEYGFDPGAFLPSYGMAEATLAVTFGHRGAGVRTDRILRGEPFERRRLAVPVDHRFADEQSRVFTRCGPALPGYRIEIRSQDGRGLPERHIGRICIQGPSLMEGYFRNPVDTSSVIGEDGWLDSGDMGYLVGGELVVTGRTKDLIIVGGRNIWPQDLEWAVEHLDGVRQGDVAAFSVTGEDDVERVVVVVECRTQKAEEIEVLRRNIATTVARRAGVECKIVMAPVRSLTFTTSGKLSRAAAKARYLEGSIRDMAETANHNAPAALRSVKNAVA